MQRHSKLVSLFLLAAVGAVVTAAAFPGSATMFHETKEVAGLAVTFGAEPEPALTEEMARNSVPSRCGARAATRVSTKRGTSLPPLVSTNPC